ncbi:MAG: type III pantothenate kinase [Planctomycetota bacterium]
MNALVAISVGNTRTQIGRFNDLRGELDASESIPNDKVDTLLERIAHHLQEVEGSDAVVAMASVNRSFSDPLRARAEGKLDIEIGVIGEDIMPAVATRVDPDATTGVDRLLCAAAAYARLKQACVVIDAGTAVTVDFVDGEGTFHGGAIAPGAAMQLRALHEHTDALPEIGFEPPPDEPFGRNTRDAMLQGVFHGIRGLAQRLIERYADAQGAFPMVVVTGGDAQTIFEHEDFVDRIVPDLLLLGIASSVAAAGVDEPATDD